MAHLKHRNICTLLGHTPDGPTHCLLYEYCNGGSLFHRLQRKREPTAAASAVAAPSPPLLSAGERLDMALDLAQALFYLHVESYPAVVHRDVKSRRTCNRLSFFQVTRCLFLTHAGENVLICEHGGSKIAKLADFQTGIVLNSNT